MNEKVRIKYGQIPHYRERIARRQKNQCPICTRDLDDNLPSLDHDHDTGAIRGVLCRNCNQIEGRVHNWVKRGRKHMTSKQYLQRMIKYWDKHTTNQTGLIHPSHGKKKSRRKRRKRTGRT